MKISNDIDSVTHAFEYAEDFFSDMNMSGLDDAMFNTNIVLDEIISNIVKYAQTDDDIDIDLSIDDDCIKVIVIDKGIPFNPVESDVERPKIKSLDNCQVGGVGLKIVKRISERMEYKRAANKNFLTVWISLSKK